MRMLLITLVSFCPLACSAEPLVTITCDPPKGVSQRFGVTDKEKKMATGAPVAAHVIPPEPDGYAAKPVFIIDSGRRKLTMLWADLPNENAREIPIISYSPDIITALDAHPGPNGSVTIYTFHPKLRILLWAMQYTPPLMDGASQTILFATCEYAWNGRP